MNAVLCGEEIPHGKGRPRGEKPSRTSSENGLHILHGASVHMRAAQPWASNSNASPQRPGPKECRAKKRAAPSRPDGHRLPNRDSCRKTPPYAEWPADLTDLALPAPGDPWARSLYHRNPGTGRLFLVGPSRPERSKLVSRQKFGVSSCSLPGYTRPGAILGRRLCARTTVPVG